MAKLVFVENIDLVNEQVIRIDNWLEEKITAIESGGAAADKKSLELEAKNRMMVQKLKAYNQGMTQLPPLKCKCGQINCDRQCGPMGTLSLQDIIEQTNEKKGGASRMSSIGPRNQANKLLNSSMQTALSPPFPMTKKSSQTFYNTPLPGTMRKKA